MDDSVFFPPHIPRTVTLPMSIEPAYFPSLTLQGLPLCGKCKRNCRSCTGVIDSAGAMDEPFCGKCGAQECAACVVREACITCRKDCVYCNDEERACPSCGAKCMACCKGEERQRTMRYCFNCEKLGYDDCYLCTCGATICSECVALRPDAYSTYRESRVQNPQRTEDITIRLKCCVACTTVRSEYKPSTEVQLDRACALLRISREELVERAKDYQCPQDQTTLKRKRALAQKSAQRKRRDFAAPCM